MSQRASAIRWDGVVDGRRSSALWPGGFQGRCPTPTKQRAHRHKVRLFAETRPGSGDQVGTELTSNTNSVRFKWRRKHAGVPQIHTDALCVPSWSLQVEGRKEWTFAKRGAAEAGVPVGDEFFGDEAYVTTLEPGELMLFFNGWHPHSTNSAPDSAFSASVHGVISFVDMAKRLWGLDGVAAKLAPGEAWLAAPSPRLLQFCPSVRQFGGFDRTGDGSCEATPAVSRLETALSGPFSDVAFGYLTSPAAADFDGDGDVDVLVGQGNGALTHLVNVGTSKSPAFNSVSAESALLAGANGARLLQPAPTCVARSEAAIRLLSQGR